MTAIAVAVIAGAFSLFAAVVSNRANTRAINLDRLLRDARRELHECREDRKNLHRIVDAFARALVGLLPHGERAELLSRIYDGATDEG